MPLVNIYDSNIEQYTITKSSELYNEIPHSVEIMYRIMYLVIVNAQMYCLLIFISSRPQSLYSSPRKLCVLSAPAYPDALSSPNFISISSNKTSGQYTYLARPGAITQPIKPKNPCPSFQVGEYAILSLLIN